MLIFKHISEKVWRKFLKVWAFLIQKDEPVERYKRSSEALAPVEALRGKPYRARGLTLRGVYTNPIYLTSYILRARIWTLPTDANYRVKTIAPDLTHTIMNTKNAGLVRITFVGPFVHQRIQRFFHAMQTDCIPDHPLRSPDKRSVQGWPAHIQKVGHIPPGFGLVDQLAGMVNLLDGKPDLAAKLHASALRCLHSGAGAFGNQAPFQLSQHADHLPHGAARGGHSIDGFGKGMEFHPTGAEIIQHRYQVAQAAAQRFACVPVNPLSP
jgi:hypothetical protein